MTYLINFVNTDYAVKHENRPTLHFMVEKVTANIIFPIQSTTMLGDVVVRALDS